MSLERSVTERLREQYTLQWQWRKELGHRQRTALRGLWSGLHHPRELGGARVLNSLERRDLATLTGPDSWQLTDRGRAMLKAMAGNSGAFWQ